MKTTANPSTQAKSIFKAHSSEWKIYIPTFLVSDIIAYIATFVKKGWDEDRINKWMKVYMAGMYGPQKINTICHASNGKSDEWKILFKINGSSNKTKIIDEALQAHPDDIDKAYAYMVAGRKAAIARMHEANGDIASIVNINDIIL